MIVTKALTLIFYAACKPLGLRSLPCCFFGKSVANLWVKVKKERILKCLTCAIRFKPLKG